MSSIVTAVLKATIGLLVNKGRDKTAEKLKDGDVTDQRMRELIVREIDDIKSKLDGLARKNLLTSISYFKHGVSYLFDVIGKAESGKYDLVSEQTSAENMPISLRSTAAGATGKTVLIAEGLKNLQFTAFGRDLYGYKERALSNAKEEFKVARLEGTKAYNNEALSTSDRLRAMVIRIAATILEKVDFPGDAITVCRLCLEELHSMPVVQSSFAVEFKQGFWARFSKAERSEIIFTVYCLNRVIYDVMQMVCCYDDERLLNWPCVEQGKDRVDVLRDIRVEESVRKQGMGCYWVPVPRSLSLEGEMWQTLRDPVGITTNTEGQLFVADRRGGVALFDSSGRYLHSLDTTRVGGPTYSLFHSEIAMDKSDNIYVLVELGSRASRNRWNDFWLCCCKETGYLECISLLIPRVGVAFHSLAVGENNKVLMLEAGVTSFHMYDLRNPLWAPGAVDVFKTDGEFVRSFGKDVLRHASDITAGNDGRVMVLDRDGTLVQVFSDEGHHLFKFKLQEFCKCSKIAFSRLKEQVLVAGDEYVLIYTKKGKFVTSIKSYATNIRGITVSDYRIFLIYIDHSDNNSTKIRIL